MTTKLEVLNHVMGVVGEHPISNEDSQHPTAIAAREVIDRINTELQIRGWWFNKEKNIKLLPNNDGEIILPSNTLEVDAVAPSSKLVQRGTKMYDPVNHTFNIGEAVFLNLIVELNIEEMPHVAAQYVMHRAAYSFYTNDDGDEQKAQRLLYEVGQAWQALFSKELRNTDVNAQDRPQVQQLKAGIQFLGGGHSNPNLPGGGT